MYVQAPCQTAKPAHSFRKGLCNSVTVSLDFPRVTEPGAPSAMEPWKQLSRAAWLPINPEIPPAPTSSSPVITEPRCFYKRGSHSRA